MTAKNTDGTYKYDPNLHSLIQTSSTVLDEPRLFITLGVEGYQVVGLVDSGSVQSYFGEGMSEIIKNKLRPTSASIKVADGNAVDIQGVVDLQIEIDDKCKTVPFYLAESLQYPCILGIDFLRIFEMRINFAMDTWSVTNGKWHSFYPYGDDPHCHSAIASLTGLNRATEDELKELEALLDELIPPTPINWE